MAARRSKSQARRHGGGGLPGWAWMVLGVVLTIGVILAAPKFMNGGDGDGFFRPRANPNAEPLATREGGDDGVAADDTDGARPATATADDDSEPDYDFYDLLPGEEVAMTDAQIAAAAREEQARAQREQQRLAQQQQATGTNGARPQPLPETAAEPRTATTAAVTSPAATATAAASSPGNDTPYVLQAGAFGGSGDAEAVKARIALLGLNARVESAQINGKTVYRVRMGPYGTASELAAAKGKLASGGLPALAIKAK